MKPLRPLADSSTTIIYLENVTMILPLSDFDALYALAFVGGPGNLSRVSGQWLGTGQNVAAYEWMDGAGYAYLVLIEL